MYTDFFFVFFSVSVNRLAIKTASMQSNHTGRLKMQKWKNREQIERVENVGVG